MMDLHWLKNFTLSQIKHSGTLQNFMMDVLKGFSAVSCVKQYLFVILTFSEVFFQYVDPVCAYNRRKILDILKNFVLRREIVNVSLKMSIRRGRPQFSSDAWN